MNATLNTKLLTQITTQKKKYHDAIIHSMFSYLFSCLNYLAI